MTYYYSRPNVDRRVKPREFREDTPKNIPFVEAVDKLDGIRLNVGRIPQLRGIPLDEILEGKRNATFERFWVSRTFKVEGRLAVRIKGTYVDGTRLREKVREVKYPGRIPVDYIHIIPISDN